MGRGQNGRAAAFGRHLELLSSHHGEGRAACHLLPAAFVKETMNSEVGTGSADFTYIKKAVCFEVGTRNADFETAKVGIQSADFKMSWVFVSRWKLAHGMPTFEQ